MDALNSFPMYIFLFSTSLFAVMTVIVEPFMRNDYAQISAQRIRLVFGLCVVVSGVTSLGLLQDYPYALSLTMGALAGYLFSRISSGVQKNQEQEPE